MQASAQGKIAPVNGSALQPALVKLIEAIEEENAALSEQRIISHAGLTDRKNHALRELMAAQRHESSPEKLAASKALLVRLSAALKINANLLKLNISALSEISNLIISSLREADSDGTYSRGRSRFEGQAL